jgi:hypothetical protein
MLRNTLVAALATIALSTNFATAESAAGHYSAAEKDGCIFTPAR